MNNKLTIVMISDEGDYPLLLKKLGQYHGKYLICLSMTKGMAEARKECIAQVESDYCLCLDMDTEVSDDYIEKAIILLSSNSKLVCIAIDYQKSQGHYAFGTSVWKTKVLKELYDYRENTGWCECIYMYHKALQVGYEIDSISTFRAIHNKEE